MQNKKDYSITSIKNDHDEFDNLILKIFCNENNFTFFFLEFTNKSPRDKPHVEILYRLAIINLNISIAPILLVCELLKRKPTQ